jgi:type VI secretion system protein ImpK
MQSMSYHIEADKTIIGGVSSAAPPGLEQAGAALGTRTPGMSFPKDGVAYSKLKNFEYQYGPNELLKSASEVFAIHYQLMHGDFSQEVERLRALLSDALVKFEMRAQQQGLGKPIIKSAKYVLCAFIDEAILNAHWSRQSNWATRSLLSQWFNETWGGETVFKVRQFCIENLNEYIQVLELIYICLSLGFRGKFALSEGGDTQLDRIKRETYQLIRDMGHHQADDALSPHWRSDYIPKKTFKQYPSLWLALGLSVSVLVITYAGLSYSLNKASAPVTQKIAHLLQQGAK